MHWFFAADLVKVYDKVSLIFLGLALHHAKVPSIREHSIDIPILAGYPTDDDNWS